MVLPTRSTAEKAAILLTAFGSEIAGGILRLLPRNHIGSITQAMKNMANLSQQEIDETFQEFYELLQKEKLKPGNADLVTGILKRAVGSESATQIMQAITPLPDRLQNVTHIDINLLKNLLEQEHPQTAAIILASASMPQCVQVLPMLTDERRIEIIFRLARLEAPNQQALSDLDEKLSILQKQRQARPQNKGGSDQVAAILAQMGTSQSNTIMEQMSFQDKELTNRIKDQMLSFSGLSELSQPDMRTLVREIAMTIWQKALRNASPQLCNRIYDSMSERVAKQLQDDILHSKPIRIHEVKTAQKVILDKALELEKLGKISFKDPADSYI